MPSAGRERNPAHQRALRQAGYASVLMFPLQLKGEIRGLVEVYRAEPIPFGPVEIRAAASALSELA